VATTDTKVAWGLEQIGPDVILDLPRGSAAVCVPVFGAHDLVVQCLRSVLTHTPNDVPILVADDATPDPRTFRFLETLAEGGDLHHRVVFLRQPRNVGFVANVQSAFGVLADADVTILNSDCIVGPEWLERLRDAAYSASTVVTATALTNHGTILSIPERNRPTDRLPERLDVDRMARLVASSSPRLRPRIPTAIGHCMYIRRSALDLVGGFDNAFSPGYGEEVDFSQRCASYGLCHVAADDVFVYHRGAGTFDEPRGLQRAHEELVRIRHPFYHDAVKETVRRDAGPLPRALAAVSVAVRPLSVTIDARFLGPTITGTQIQAVELISALWRTRRADLRVLVPTTLGAWARVALEALDGLEILETSSKALDGAERTDIVHRPSQLFAWEELQLLTELGKRLVITNLDLISYRNAAYHSSFTDWREYQRLTRLALSLADEVVFMSAHAREDALVEDLVDRDRAHVVPLGVDHQATARPRRPRDLPDAADDNFLLCIGTDFRHKNRPFVLRLFDELRDRGWNGWLVFAGPHAAFGTSAGEEAEYLATHPATAARTTNLRAVDEAEKAWLLQHCSGVVYPTTCEGFGLVPFEAAASGAPCFFAYHTALCDVLPERAATLVQWSPSASADAVIEVLANDERRNEQIAVVRDAAAALTWTNAAEEMLDVYTRAVSDRHRDVVLLAEERVPTSLHTLTTMRNPEVLEAEPELYRALYTLTTNSLTKRPFGRTVTALYKLGHLARHGRLPEPPTSTEDR